MALAAQKIAQIPRGRFGLGSDLAGLTNGGGDGTDAGDRRGKGVLGFSYKMLTISEDIIFATQCS